MTAGDFFYLLNEHKSFILESYKLVSEAYAKGRQRKDATTKHVILLYATLSNFRNQELELWAKAKRDPQETQKMMNAIAAYDLAPLKALLNQDEIMRRRKLRESLRRLIGNVENLQHRMRTTEGGMTPKRFKQHYRYKLGSYFGAAVIAAHEELNTRRIPLIYLF